MVYENCILGRIDNHYGCRDYYINNCIFTTSVAAIYIGFGDGTFIIENCKFIKNDDTSFYNGTDQNCIYLRNDLCALYSGTIICKNIEIENNTSKTIRFISATYDNLNYGNNTNVILPCYMPKLIFKNINTKKTSNLILVEELLRSGNYLVANDLHLYNQDIYINNCYCANIDIRTEYANANTFNIKITDSEITSSNRINSNINKLELYKSDIYTNDLKNIISLVGQNLILTGNIVIENMTNGLFTNISDGKFKFTSCGTCKINDSILTNSPSLDSLNNITNIIINNCQLIDNRDFHATNVIIENSIIKMINSSYINANQTNLAKFVMINSLVNTESRAYNGFNAGNNVKVLLKNNYGMNEQFSSTIAEKLENTNTL